MQETTRRTVHLGVNFRFAPPPRLDGKAHIRWQEQLQERGLRIERNEMSDTAFNSVRQKDGPMQVKVVLQGPIAQLLIIGQEPVRPAGFIDEAGEVCEAFHATWPGPRQIIARDATLRHLYACDRHAFQELWEDRLEQSAKDLAVLGQHVLGGGLRFVIPPKNDTAPQVEVKIESFLRDPKLMFVQTQFTWNQALPPSSEQFDAGALVAELESYATGPVVEFIKGGKS